MSIFSAELTPEEIKNNEILRCATYRKGTLEALYSAYIVSFNDFWYNSIVTPQEVCNFYGNQAGQLFYVSSKTFEFMYLLNPTLVPPFIPFEFTVNEDGTVTIGEPIEPPEV